MTLILPSFIRAHVISLKPSVGEGLEVKCLEVRQLYMMGVARATILKSGLRALGGYRNPQGHYKRSHLS